MTIQKILYSDIYGLKEDGWTITPELLIENAYYHLYGWLDPDAKRITKENLEEVLYEIIKVSAFINKWEQKGIKSAFHGKKV